MMARGALASMDARNRWLRNVERELARKKK
jgi:hypothetical protein